MNTEVGFAEGVCPNCGRVWHVRRPASSVLCDCYRICPLCLQLMYPYVPDLDPSAYGPIEGWGGKAMWRIPYFLEKRTIVPYRGI